MTGYVGYYYCHVGLGYACRGDFENALVNLELAQERHKISGDLRALVGNGANLIIANRLAGRGRESIRCALEQVALSTKANVYVRARSFALLGFCHHALDISDAESAAVFWGGVVGLEVGTSVGQDPADKLARDHLIERLKA